MYSDIEKTFIYTTKEISKETYSLSEIASMLKTNILVYTGSPRLTEIEWKFGYNPKTKQCDLDDGTGHIKRTTKDINRVTYGLDFGPGVYLTGDKGLACSWACTQMNTENENDDIPEMSRNRA